MAAVLPAWLKTYLLRIRFGSWSALANHAAAGRADNDRSFQAGKGPLS